MAMTVHYDGKPGEATLADLVFVHGLRGDPIETWSKGSVCWPRDLLKEDIDRVRIMSWAYDSGVAHFLKSASQVSIFGHGESLLSDLAEQRLSPQQALIRSAQLYNHKESLELGRIYQYTRGVVFMATPHRGSGKTPYVDIVVNAARVTLRNPNKELLNSLRENAAPLNQERKTFTTIRDQVPIVCLYEESATTLGIVSADAKKRQTLVDLVHRLSAKTRLASMELGLEGNRCREIIVECASFSAEKMWATSVPWATSGGLSGPATLGTVRFGTQTQRDLWSKHQV
ncbi:hypothetical protein HO133_004281 [Letharia lupina]|uniref:Uncharacterized protein n=1 Tax=Letharia lupina TaxID=560253 RepID=A0A8H6FJX6_9LECA|nr:uncharacterized protein HO133_004281 [Letharia lupina]KAF6229944.1 hypothetical protein HO133_004281 [Letharia lupina]